MLALLVLLSSLHLTTSWVQPVLPGSQQGRAICDVPHLATQSSRVYTKRTMHAAMGDGSHRRGSRRASLASRRAFCQTSFLAVGMATSILMFPKQAAAASEEGQLSIKPSSSLRNPPTDEKVELRDSGSLVNEQADTSSWPERSPELLALKEGAEREGGLVDFLSGLAGGAASRASKELLLHPIDTIKTRLQYARSGEEISFEELTKDLYSGVWPALLVGTPAGAAFFGTKDWLKGVAKRELGSQYRELATIGAVFLANIPYWCIRTPAEVVKTRQQTGLANSTREAVSTIYEKEGPGGLYNGLTSNIAYAFPTDAIKFLVYERLQGRWVAAQGGVKLSPLQSSLCGSAASSVAQILSTPLDVVRTRLMTQRPDATQDESYTGIIDCLQRITRDEGPAKLFSGILPRLTRAFLSGAIQFGSYEATKNLLK